MESNEEKTTFEGLNIRTSEMEEEEDLEEHRKRQKELHNLLAVAMDDFNYDDQSTIGSSANASYDETSKLNAEKYREAAFEDQLKVLYEVRVREVESLKHTVGEMKKQQAEELEKSTRKYMLCEADRIKAQTSLHQCQDILSEKAEEILNLRSELKIANELTKQQKDHINELEQERNLDKMMIDELNQKINFIQQGVLRSAQMSEDELRNCYQTKVDQLENLLETSNKRLQIFEEENNNLRRENLNIAQQFNALVKTHEACQAQCNNLKDLVNTLETKKSKLKEKSNMFKQQMLESTQQLKQALESIDQFQKILFSKDQTIQEMSRRNNLGNYDGKSQSDASIQVSKSQSDASIQVSFDAESKINQNAEETDVLQEEICKLKAELNAERSKFSALTRRCSETEKCLEQIIAKKIELPTKQLREIGTNSSFCEMSDSVYLQLKAELHDKNLYLKAAYDEIETLKKSKCSITIGTNTESEVENPTSKITISTDTIDLQDNYTTGLQKLVESKSEMVFQLKKKIVQDREALANEFDKWSKRMAIIENRKECMTAALVDLQNQISTLKSSETKNLAKIENMSIKITDLKNELGVFTKEKQQDKVVIAEMERLLTRERNKLTLFNSRLEELHQKYNAQLNTTIASFNQPLI